MAPPAPRRRPSRPLFPKLSGRTPAIGAEQVAGHQRGRLMAAMVEAVSRHGYEEVTVGEVVALAGVSKTAFYRNFAGKEECFLATFEEIVKRGADRIGEVYRSRQAFPERLRATFESFVELIAERPGEARLVIVDSLSLGAASVEPRARAAALVEARIRESVAEAELSAEVSDVTIRAVVGGIRNLIYLALRDGRQEELRDQVGELTQWGLSYLRAAERRAAGGPSVGARLVAEVNPGGSGGEEPAVAGEEQGLAWEEPANSPRSRAELTQRERIMRGAAQVAVEKGYATLTISAISAAAGTSNQTFYENFDSTQEAFLAAYDAAARRAFEVTAHAFVAQGGWLQGGVAAMVALLQFFAREPLYRALAASEVPAAGTEAQDRGEALLEPFKAFLRPNPLTGGETQQLSEVVIEAIAGGTWAVVQGEILEGRAESLPAMAPEIVDIVLEPLGLE